MPLEGQSSKRKKAMAVAPVECERCGVVVMRLRENARRQRFCSRSCLYAHRKAHAIGAKPTIAYISTADQMPTSKPRRYISSSGYVRLRWKIGKRHYVEAWEHRVISGATVGEHAHHIDHDRSNNSPDNLQRAPAREHMEHHCRERRMQDIEDMIRAYMGGESPGVIAARYGRNSAAVYRALRNAGVPMRDRAAAALNRRVPVDETLVAREYVGGASLERVARVFNVSAQVVVRVLVNLGIPRRRCGRQRQVES